MLEIGPMIPDSVARLRRKTRRVDSGKFKRSRRLGVTMEAGGEHLGWQFEVSRVRVGVTVRRDVHNVTIRDEHGSLLERLSGFAKREQAVQAARQWIEQTQPLVELRIDREHRQKDIRALKRRTGSKRRT